MTDTIYNKVGSYLESLSATNIICSELGTTLAINDNVTIGFRRDSEGKDTIAIIPIPGGRPKPEGERQESGLKIEVRSSSRERCLKVGQAFINVFSNNHLNGNGLIIPSMSNPIMIESLDGGRNSVSIVNYIIKHKKVS